MLTAVDTETELAGNRNPIPALVCVSFASELGVDVVHHSDPRLPSMVVGALQGGAIFANAPFDLFVLWRHLGPELWPHIRAALEAGRIFDVLTREKLIDIAQGKHRQRGPYNLGAVAERRAGIKLDKHDPWRRRYGALRAIPIKDWPEAAIAYSQLDAWATLQTYIAQEAERARHRVDVFEDAARQARAHLALYAMTLRGIHTDAARVEALDKLLSERIRRLEARILIDKLGRYKHVKKRPSPVVRTKAAAQAALVEWCRATGRSPMRNDLTDAARMRGETLGSIAMSKKALEAAGVPRGKWIDLDLVDKADPTKPSHPLEVYRELGGLRASYSKNIPVLKHPVIRTRYDELVSSGRTSASGFKAIQIEDADDDDDDSLADFDCELEPGDEWVGTNTQNFGRDGGWRECLIPPPGKRLGSTDYGALELVTFAQVQLDMFKRSKLADLLRAGKDPHRAFAAEHVLRISYESFDKAKHNDSRQLAKAWNFGKPGGMGEGRFIEWAWVTYDVAITPAQHKQIDAVYHAAFPEVRMFWHAIKSRMQTGHGDRGPVYTVQQPRTNRIRGGCGFPDAANTHFQGLGADVAKRAAWLLFCAGLDPASPLHGCYQILFEHDAFSTVIDDSPDHRPWPKGTPNAAAAIAAGSCACRGCVQLAEQERIMIQASAELCPDVPMKVESTNTDRYQK